MLPHRFVVPFILGVFLCSTASAGTPINLTTIKADVGREMSRDRTYMEEIQGGTPLKVTDVKPDAPGKVSNVVVGDVPVPHFTQHVWMFYTDKFDAKFKQFVTVEYEKVDGHWEFQSLERHIATELSPPTKLPPKPALPSNKELTTLTAGLYTPNDGITVGEVVVGKANPKFEWVVTGDDRFATYWVPLAQVSIVIVGRTFRDGSSSTETRRCDDLVLRITFVDNGWKNKLKTNSPTLIAKDGVHKFDANECTLVGPAAPSGPRKK